MEWGAWPEFPSEILMGILPPPARPRKASSLPSSVQVAGVVLSPDRLDKHSKEVFAPLRDRGREGWWIIPADSKAYTALSAEHYQLAHRLGVSLWLEAPSLSMWGAYLDVLAQSSRILARAPDWEQWVWPACDLIEQGFEETLLLGSPTFKSRPPWKWVGKARNPDWTKTGFVVWEEFEKSLGGRGALEEILVANSLWREKLLVR